MWLLECVSSRQWWGIVHGECLGQNATGNGAASSLQRPATRSEDENTRVDREIIKIVSRKIIFLTMVIYDRFRWRQKSKYFASARFFA
ncbi:hypothetical protein FQZ97_1109680 [compost metagenome]